MRKGVPRSLWVYCADGFLRRQRTGAGFHSIAARMGRSPDQTHQMLNLIGLCFLGELTGLVVENNVQK